MFADAGIIRVLAASNDMLIFENIREALRAVRANLLRAVLTILVIAFGLMALVGVLTAIDGIRFWMESSFSSLGANTITIQNYPSNLFMSGRRTQRQYFPAITYNEALRFQEEFSRQVPVSVVAMASRAAKAHFGGKETGDNLQLIGVDEYYLGGSNLKLDQGRNLNHSDVSLNRKVIILGKEVEKQLFPRGGALGKTITISGKSYLVIGTLQSMGMAGAMGGDLINLIPVSTVGHDFPADNRSYSLNLYVNDPERRGELELMAAGLMRQVRGLRPKEEDNFGTTRLDGLYANLMQNLSFLTLSATLIAVITLFSASIGLMNIMLVSVTERTREIGIRKALGATRRSITFQFLTECILICLTGGVIGIIFGVAIGNLIGMLLGMSFFVPWEWVGGGMLLCTFVGLVSGIFPAIRAAKVDPIESLRYE